MTVKLILIFGAMMVVFGLVFPREKTVVVNGQEIKVMIADSPAERERGLSGKKSLAHNEGMLFIFPEPTRPAFWMKDMQFAIDIIWLDENFKILGGAKKVSPDTYPATFVPEQDIRYVLETDPGLVPF